MNRKTAVYRRLDTGKFVSLTYWKKHPKQTFRQWVNIPNSDKHILKTGKWHEVEKEVL